MKTTIFAALLLFSPGALAQTRTVEETCNAYRYEETYIPGHADTNGRWIKGRTQVQRQRIACAPRGSQIAHHQPAYAPPPAYQHHRSQQPIQVNVRRDECEGKLMRMGLGAIGGGFAGRYAVGGKKSKYTILGTTIGAAAGSLIGRATC